MPTILDVEYRPRKRTLGEIFVSWFIISTISFFVINWFQVEYGFTDVISRYISTMVISLIVGITIAFIKINEEVKK